MNLHAKNHSRAYWLKTLHQWHWISSAVCLVAMLLFSVTGFTLNHAAQIEARAEVVTQQAQLPAALQRQLAADGDQSNEERRRLPVELAAWLETEWGIASGDRLAEWSAEEIYLSLPRPGGDAWLRVDRGTAEVEYEQTDRGWIAYFNDLHKGRDTGTAWSWFIDVFAAVSLVFCITGLLILKMHAANRPAIWPVTGLGLVIPVVIALLFIH